MTAGSRPFRAGKRVLSGVAAGAIAVPLSFGMMGTAFATGQYPGNQNAKAPTPVSTDTACPPGQVTNPGFTDTSNDFWKLQIWCIAKYGWAQGTSSTTYSPGRNVTRAEMAAFVGRLAKAAGLPWDTSPHGFTDISNQSQEFQDDINALANAGVISGHTTTEFQPTASVTRAQMAKFIANTLVKTGVAQSGSAGTNDYFADDDGIPGGLEPYINDLAADKVVQGVDDTHYVPNRSVLRDQMAGFIARTTELEVEANKINNAFPPASNQSLAVSPSTQATNTTSTYNVAVSTDNRGSRTYTVSGLDSTKKYNLSLFDAANVVNNNGNVTFKSNSPLTPSNGGPSIETVNGAPAGVSGSNGGEKTTYNGVSPVNGSITFTVDSTKVAQVVPVAYQDANSNGVMDFSTTPSSTSPQAPKESFGVGGEKDWIPAEASSGAYTNETVSQVNVPEKYFVTVSGKLFKWDSNDTFTYDAGVDGATGNYYIPMSSFEQVISKDDVLATITYSQGASSNFTFDTDVPAAPTGVTATNYDANGDGTTDSIVVTWTAPANPDVASYKVERATVDSNGTVSSWQDVTATDADTDVTNTKYVDAAGDATPLAGNTNYVYRVTAIADAANGAAASKASDKSSAVTFPAAANTATPYSTTAVFIDNSTGGNTTVDANDVIRVQFDSAVTVASDASVTAIDADGTTAKIACGTTAVCTTSGTSSTLLTMTLNYQPVPSNLGGNGVLNSTTPLEILSETGVSNANGAWNLPRSGQEVAGADRAIVGSNSDLPSGPTELSVTTDATDGGNTIGITDTALGNATAGDTIQVFDVNGNLLGSADIAADNTETTVTLSKAVSSSQALFINFVDNDSTFTGNGGKAISSTLAYQVP